MDKWWVPGLGIGYEHSFVHQVADFLKSLETGEACAPTFKDALETQKVCEAVLSSAASRSWKETGAEGFATCMDQVTADPTLLQRLREQGQVRYRAEFTWPHVLQQYEDLLLKYLPH